MIRSSCGCEMPAKRILCTAVLPPCPPPPFPPVPEVKSGYLFAVSDTAQQVTVRTQALNFSSVPVAYGTCIYCDVPDGGITLADAGNYLVTYTLSAQAQNASQAGFVLLANGAAVPGSQTEESLAAAKRLYGSEASTGNR